MILPVLLYTNKILNTACQPVTDFTDLRLESTTQDLIETCIANNGVGLAANQVGINRSICVVRAENKTKILVLINPKIVAYDKKKNALMEACLSCPGLSVNMKRPNSLIIDANMPTGELVRYEFTGFDARIAVHEIEHLNGLTLARTVQNYIGMI